MGVGLAIAALVLAAPAARAGDEVGRQKLTVGGDMAFSPTTDEGFAVGGLIDERLWATVIDGDAIEGQVFLKARLRYQLSEEVSRWENSRVREARLHLDGGGWQLDVGRIGVDHGMRLVDGVQGLASLGGGWWAGAYGGAGADPYTTLPGVRFGGGPVIRYEGDAVQWQALGELMVAPGGLDRAAFVTDARVEVSDAVEVSARVDLQHRGPTQPISLADGVVFLIVHPPVDGLRLDAFYDAYSSLAYLTTEKQDPSITRFDARAFAADPELAAVADTLDDTLYHLVGASARYRPRIGGANLHLRATGRYRYHPDPAVRFARGTLEQGVVGVGGGRLDVTVAENVLQWGGTLGYSAAGFLYLEPFPEAGIALDASAEVGLKPLLDSAILAPQIYADGYLDWITPDGRFILSGGYALTVLMDFDVWDQNHAGMLRVTWVERLRRGDR